jgi:hypothetical protein
LPQPRRRLKRRKWRRRLVMMSAGRRMA